VLLVFNLRLLLPATVEQHLVHHSLRLLLSQYVGTCCDCVAVLVMVQLAAGASLTSAAQALRQHASPS
jgi:hypothetical protein